MTVDPKDVLDAAQAIEKELLGDLALDKIRCFEDGTPVVVARPANPKRAMEIAAAVGTGNSPEVQQRWDEMHDKLNEECGPYTFVDINFWGENPLETDDAS